MTPALIHFFASSKSLKKDFLAHCSRTEIVVGHECRWQFSLNSIVIIHTILLCHANRTVSPHEQGLLAADGMISVFQD